MSELSLKEHHRISYPKRIALGYLLIIILGTILLMLPVSSRDGQSAGFLNALFTATSASCVTGLIVFDTYTQWTLFGQIVIITLIQIGGLGFMAFIAMFSFFFKKKIGLGMRDMLKESVNVFSIGGIVRLFKKILIGTLIFELSGAVILTLRFLKYMPLGEAIFCGIFHSISAFCNAGFDILGRFTPFSSVTLFATDPIICFTLCALIIIGGIGFFVWEDLSKHKFKFKEYMLHTKIAISMTIILLLGGMIGFFILEYNNTLGDFNFIQKFCVSFYLSTTPRTAGFNFVDTQSFTIAAKALTIFLMFIGGSSGSTAGGIKVTTLAVILISAVSMLYHKKSDNIFGRRLEDDALKRASFVVTINLSLIFTAAMITFASMPNVPPMDILLEIFSAIDTVGLSANLTPMLNDLSKTVMILLMYCGRVGSMSFALLFIDKQVPAVILKPEEKINIG